MAKVPSRSHHVFVGSDVVVKVIEADRHSRLDREILLAPHLPPCLTAPLLASGLHRLDGGDVRYACYARVPGGAPGMGLPGIDEATARRLAEVAIGYLQELHRWAPAGSADETLREPLDHGGFVGRAALLAEIGSLAAVDRHGFVPPSLLDGLEAIAERSPQHAPSAVPVHADCHWGNWLACNGKVTALLDFEWARFGDPVDDWFFLARYSGAHMEAVLDVIARATASPVEVLRTECEIREAAYLASDLHIALERADIPSMMAADRLCGLEELIQGRYWWRHSP
jgi:hypothetical protein